MTTQAPSVAVAVLPDLQSEPDRDAISHAPRNIDLKLRIVNLIAVLLPFAGLIVAVTLLWGVAFTWHYLVLMAVMYGLSAIGITIGYHRYFTHKSFDTPKPVAFVLAVLGSMAVQGPLLQWVAVHRSHHQHSDDEGDPHSPHAEPGGTSWGRGIWGVLKGAYHAHLGWIVTPRRKSLAKYVKDLRDDRVIRAASAMFPLWVLIGLLIPAVAGALMAQLIDRSPWEGAFMGFLWGGLVRVFLVHHVTWSVNSVCHLWGYKSFRSHDESRNNPIFGVLALGEGWHNNHHAFPTSARHGLRWWEFDISYLIIRGMGLVGLARNIRVPTPDRVAAKRA